MLEAARELHKFFYDAKEVLAMIQEKENLLTDDLGRDLNSLHQLQVVHQGFEADLAPLGNQVRWVRKISRPFGDSCWAPGTFPAFLRPGCSFDWAPKFYNILPPFLLEISRLYKHSRHFLATSVFFYSLTNTLGQHFRAIWRSFADLNCLFSSPGRRRPRGGKSSPGLLRWWQSQGNSSQRRRGSGRMEAAQLAGKTTHWAPTWRRRLVQIPFGCSGSDVVDERHVEADFNLWESEVSVNPSEWLCGFQTLYAV